MIQSSSADATSGRFRRESVIISSSPRALEQGRMRRAKRSQVASTVPFIILLSTVFQGASMTARKSPGPSVAIMGIPK